MALLDLTTGTLRPEGREPGVVLEPTADTGALAAAAADGGIVAINFPNFGDGRGHSLAVLLRERHGFSGEVRAVGYLIPDLAPFLLRSGFDTAEITDANDVDTWHGALTQHPPSLSARLTQPAAASPRCRQARRGRPQCAPRRHQQSR